MLQDENDLLKDGARALKEELERWKEASKKQSTRVLDALPKDVIQFEDPLFNKEKEEFVCPECGYLFKLASYKFEKMEIAAWIWAHSI